MMPKPQPVFSEVEKPSLQSPQADQLQQAKEKAETLLQLSRNYSPVRLFCKDKNAKLLAGCGARLDAFEVLCCCQSCTTPTATDTNTPYSQSLRDFLQHCNYGDGSFLQGASCSEVFASVSVSEDTASYRQESLLSFMQRKAAELGGGELVGRQLHLFCWSVASQLHARRHMTWAPAVVSSFSAASGTHNVRFLDGTDDHMDIHLGLAFVHFSDKPPSPGQPPLVHPSSPHPELDNLRLFPSVHQPGSLLMPTRSLGAASPARGVLDGTALPPRPLHEGHSPSANLSRSLNPLPLFDMDSLTAAHGPLASANLHDLMPLDLPMERQDAAADGAERPVPASGRTSPLKRRLAVAAAPVPPDPDTSRLDVLSEAAARLYDEEAGGGAVPSDVHPMKRARGGGRGTAASGSKRARRASAEAAVGAGADAAELHWPKTKQQRERGRGRVYTPRSQRAVAQAAEGTAAEGAGAGAVRGGADGVAQAGEDGLAEIASTGSSGSSKNSETSSVNPSVEMIEVDQQRHRQSKPAATVPHAPELPLDSNDPNLNVPMLVAPLELPPGRNEPSGDVLTNFSFQPMGSLRPHDAAAAAAQPYTVWDPQAAAAAAGMQQMSVYVVAGDSVGCLENVPSMGTNSVPLVLLDSTPYYSSMMHSLGPVDLQAVPSIFTMLPSPLRSDMLSVRSQDSFLQAFMDPASAAAGARMPWHMQPAPAGVAPPGSLLLPQPQPQQQARYLAAPPALYPQVPPHGLQQFLPAGLQPASPEAAQTAAPQTSRPLRMLDLSQPLPDPSSTHSPSTGHDTAAARSHTSAPGQPCAPPDTAAIPSRASIIPGALSFTGWTQSSEPARPPEPLKIPVQPMRLSPGNTPPQGLQLHPYFVGMQGRSPEQVRELNSPLLEQLAVTRSPNPGAEPRLPIQPSSLLSFQTHPPADLTLPGLAAAGHLPQQPTHLSDLLPQVPQAPKPPLPPPAEPASTITTTHAPPSSQVSSTTTSSAAPPRRPRRPIHTSPFSIHPGRLAPAQLAAPPTQLPPQPPSPDPLDAWSVFAPPADSYLPMSTQDVLGRPKAATYLCDLQNAALVLVPTSCPSNKPLRSQTITIPKGAISISTATRPSLPMYPNRPSFSTPHLSSYPLPAPPRTLTGPTSRSGELHAGPSAGARPTGPIRRSTFPRFPSPFQTTLAPPSPSSTSTAPTTSACQNPPPNVRPAPSFSFPNPPAAPTPDPAIRIPPAAPLAPAPSRDIYYPLTNTLPPPPRRTESPRTLSTAEKGLSELNSLPLPSNPNDLNNIQSHNLLEDLASLTQTSSFLSPFTGPLITLNNSSRSREPSMDPPAGAASTSPSNRPPFAPLRSASLPFPPSPLRPASLPLPSTLRPTSLPLPSPLSTTTLPLLPCRTPSALPLKHTPNPSSAPSQSPPHALDSIVLLQPNPTLNTPTTRLAAAAHATSRSASQPDPAPGLTSIITTGIPLTSDTPSLDSNPTARSRLAPSDPSSQTRLSSVPSTSASRMPSVSTPPSAHHPSNLPFGPASQYNDPRRAYITPLQPPNATNNGIPEAALLSMVNTLRQYPPSRPQQQQVAQAQPHPPPQQPQQQSQPPQQPQPQLLRLQLPSGVSGGMITTAQLQQAIAQQHQQHRRHQQQYVEPRPLQSVTSGGARGAQQLQRHLQEQQQHQQQYNQHQHKQQQRQQQLLPHSSAGPGTFGSKAATIQHATLLPGMQHPAQYQLRAQQPLPQAGARPAPPSSAPQVGILQRQQQQPQQLPQLEQQRPARQSSGGGAQASQEAAPGVVQEIRECTQDFLQACSWLKVASEVRRTVMMKMQQMKQQDLVIQHVWLKDALDRSDQEEACLILRGMLAGTPAEQLLPALSS